VVGGAKRRPDEAHWGRVEKRGGKVVGKGRYVPPEKWKELKSEERKEVYEARKKEGRKLDPTRTGAHPAVNGSMKRMDERANNRTVVVEALNPHRVAGKSYAGVVAGTANGAVLRKASLLNFEEKQEEWLVNLPEESRKLMERIKEAKETKTGVWRVHVNAHVLPAAKHDTWTREVKKMAYAMPEGKVVDTHIRPDGVELILNCPVLIEVGCKLLGCEVTLSEPVMKELCTTMLEWTEEGVGGVLEGLLRGRVENVPLLGAIVGRRMMIISEGPIMELCGHDEIAYDGYTLARRSRAYGKACRRCHGMGHYENECMEFWSDKQDVLDRSQGFICRTRTKERPKKAAGVFGAPTEEPDANGAVEAMEKRHETLRFEPSHDTTDEHLRRMANEMATLELGQHAECPERSTPEPWLEDL